jgi:ferritin-like metal-binding protein YciE
MSAAMSDPRELFLHELQDIYYAENTITKALPTMIREAGDKELVKGLKEHLEETKEQIKVLEQVFEQIGEKAKGERCPGIEGLKTEHDEFMSEESPTPEICDMFLTGAAARVEHYEIAAYTGLVTLARGLGETECATLLEENLSQEKEALKAVETVSKRLAKDAKQLVAA